MIRSFIAAAAALMLAGSATAQAPSAPAVAAILHAGRLLADPSTGTVTRVQSVLIGADGRIAAVWPKVKAAEHPAEVLAALSA